MSKKWDGQSKSNSLGYRTFIVAMKAVGFKNSYFFLKIVARVFYFTAKDAKKQLLKFYKITHNLDGYVAKKMVKKNFFTFGSTIVDKYGLTMGIADCIKFKSHGNHLLKPVIKDPDNGLLLVSAHLGNWEIAEKILKTYGDKKVNIVLVDNEKIDIKKLEEQFNRKNLNLIPMGKDMMHIFKIHAALQRNEIVCMHGDRFVEGAKTLELDFFDRKVNFPKGVYEIGVKLKVPIAFVFNLKSDNFTYNFYSSVPQVYSDSKSAGQAFASSLEEKVRKHPEQWFNYYNYFD